MDTSTLSRPSGPPTAREAHALPSDRIRRSRQVPDRLARVWRGDEDDPAWARPALLGLLLATGVLYLWGLGESGWANSFYSAAVQAGSESWKAFFFGSSDAASSITVDKTPLSLWPMALSVRLFGLSSWSILVPQALMGIGTVALLHRLVRRTTGSAAAGLIAGAVMALTPVAVLMFRFNNPDAMLTLLMVGAAAATLRGIDATSQENGHPVRWLSLGGALVGLAFLTKMLQAFLVLPALALAYLLFARTSWGKRLGHLSVAFGSMLLAGGWWIAIVELWPASSRPYIGGSQNNSILELTLGYNGLGRLSGNETGSVGGGGAGGTGNWGETGLFRLFNSEIGGQVAWLLPAALVLGAAALWFARRQNHLRAGLTLWLTWLVVTALTFSFMAGIFHAYYTVALAPAIAALVGIGAWVLWQHRESYVATGILSFSTALTSVLGWYLLDRADGFVPWLKWVVLIVGMVAALALAGIAHLPKKVALAVAAAALAATLAGPAAYAVSTASTPHTGSIPSAGPSSGSGGPGGMPGGGGGPRGQLGTPPGQTAQGGQTNTRSGDDRHPGAEPDARRRCGWSAERQHLDRRGHGSAADRRRQLHVGGCGRRRQQRRRLPARQRAAGDGHRRLQRQRPEPDARPVPAVRRQRSGALVHRLGRHGRRHGRWDVERQQQRDRAVGRRQLHGHHRGRRDALRPLGRDPVTAMLEPSPGEPRTEVATATVLDVVIPVYNEEAQLAASVERVLEHLRTMPWSFRITVADNASTDQTALIARRLSHTHPEVSVVHLAEKGRGRALKRVWSDSASDVLVYMDVDLSTDLAALLPLVAPLVSGHSDLAIGSRLSRHSRVERGARREFISRSYNLLLRRALRARFSDAQCGFKAIRRDAARELLPLVEDNAWFFDTELLVVAERAGLRIHEVPVDWVDDPDSSVDIVRTAMDDLKGMVRLGRSLVRGTLPLREIGERLGRTSTEAGRGRLGMQLGIFLVIGVCSTLAYALLYLGLRSTMTPWWANFTALLRHRGRKHSCEPPVHLRGARAAGRRTSSGAGAGHLRRRTGRDDRVAVAVARRHVSEPRAGGRRAHGGEPRRHGAALRRDEALGLR